MKKIRLKFSASTSTDFDQGFFLDWKGQKTKDIDGLSQRTDFSRRQKPRGVSCYYIAVRIITQINSYPNLDMCLPVHITSCGQASRLNKSHKYETINKHNTVDSVTCVSNSVTFKPILGIV